jgi:hypothetical protein
MPKLSIQEAAGSGFSHAVRFDYLDLQTSGFLTTGGAANQRVVGSLSAGAIVEAAAFIQVTDPSGATDLTIDFGTTAADPDELLDNGDVDGATKLLFNTGDAFAQSTTGATLQIKGAANNTTSAVDLIMEFNGTVGDLTAGEWVLAWKVLDPQGLAN